MQKQAIVIHSGGMDSSLCLAKAINDYGKDNVLSMSFRYGQRHSLELARAALICRHWDVDHIELSLDCLNQITNNALMNDTADIVHNNGEVPNTIVIGRNGLMARLGAIHANMLGAHKVYMGVLELETANSGYPDCNRPYMDLMQDILRIDLNDPEFEIVTPLIFMSKKQTMELGYELGVLDYLLEMTVTCYRGIEKAGCGTCPACLLRNEGLLQFAQEHPEFEMPYEIEAVA